MQDIFFTLPEETEGTNGFVKAISALNKHFKPQANVPYDDTNDWYFEKRNSPYQYGGPLGTCSSVENYACSVEYYLFSVQMLSFSVEM